jgi:hypothetical protein
LQLYLPLKNILQIGLLDFITAEPKPRYQTISIDIFIILNVEASTNVTNNHNKLDITHFFCTGEKASVQNEEKQNSQKIT